MYIDLGWIIAIVFYIFWIILGIILISLIQKRYSGEWITMGFELMIQTIEIFVTIGALILTVLIYGGIFWW